jgi:hypothetical protein
MREATCKGCGASILWFKTVRGKNIPADAKSETRIIMNAEGQAVMVASYMPHHATCPEVDKFRKEK